MPFIDVSTIEGFDSMTAEQKVEALTKFEIPESVDLSRYVSKEVFDKKASEAAGLSKQLKEKMTEDEKKAAETDEANRKILEELEQLRKDKTISELTAKYLNLGYDAELAKETAEAMQSGNMEKVFANGAKHKEALEKKIMEDLMNKTPKPDGAGGNDDKTDFAVKKAKELAAARIGSGKQYENVMNQYIK